MQEAALPCISTWVFLFLCFRIPWVLQYPPWSSQAPTKLEGEGIKLIPCHILIQCRRAKGFVPQNGVPRTLRPFAEEHPWAVPMGAVELPMAASWGHHGSPFPVLCLPKSLETHQRSSPTTCLDLAACRKRPLFSGGLQLSGETKCSWVALSLYFCRTGGERSLQKLFIIDPAESFGLVLGVFLAFKNKQKLMVLAFDVYAAYL